MKKVYMLVAMLIAAFAGHAQEKGEKIFFPANQDRPVVIRDNDHIPGLAAKSTAVNCGPDTIQYPYLKELAFRAPNDSFFIDAMVGSVRTASQAYLLNDTLEVLGVQFWGQAYTPSTVPQSQQVMVYLYEVDAFFQPVAAIDSTIITITEQSDFYEAMFASAHTVWFNYAVGVRCLTNDTIAIVTNNAGSPSFTPNYGESLGWRRFGSGAWNSTLSFFGQDMEYMIFPIVSYSISSEFTVADDSVCIDVPQTFINNSSPILSSRFYNLHAFDEYWNFTGGDSTFTWRYGTGLDSSATYNGAFTYTTPGTMTVELQADMLGYYTSCSETTTATVEIMDSINITMQPIDAVILNGDTTSFVVGATGAVLSYSWEVSTDSGATWSPLTDGGWYNNTDTAILDIYGADTTANGYQYRAIIVSECGIDTTIAVALTVDAPLSVSLVSFTAMQRGSAVALNWATSSEKNSDRFEISRSADGRKYTTIASVKSTGDNTSGHKYEIMDNEPLKGQNIYMLTEYDQNGKAAHHGVRSVMIGGDTPSDIAVYPNPARNSFTIDARCNATVTITDVTGRVISTFDVNGVRTISTTGMNSGVYLLQIRTDNAMHTRKLMIDMN